MNSSPIKLGQNRPKRTLRMTRISLQELTDFAQGQGCNVVLPSSSLPFNNDKRERNKKNANAKPETGNVNKKAKCRR